MNKNRGFTMVELMVVTILFAVITTAGSMLFLAGQSAWAVTNARIIMRDHSSRILRHISNELQQSGTNSAGVLQAVIADNAGLNGADILRFSIPICPCGVSAMDENGDTQYWGASLTWGRTGCGDDYPVDVNNKVSVCHLPPGNPNNPQTINVSVNAVKSHMVHGDWIGDCNMCNPAGYTNRFVEYQLGTNNRLWRRVLDSNLVIINEAVIADSVTDFQAAFNAGQTAVDITIILARNALQNRQVIQTGSINVVLRNRG